MIAHILAVLCNLPATADSAGENAALNTAAAGEVCAAISVTFLILCVIRLRRTSAGDSPADPA